MRQSGADLAEEERPYGQYQTATHPPPTSPSTRSSTTPQLPAPDDAVTRSAEHLTVGTEQVSQTVPDSHEVTIERGPITDSNINDAMDEPASSEEEHEVVLSEERPLVQMVAVPVDRVRVSNETAEAGRSHRAGAQAADRTRRRDCQPTHTGQQARRVGGGARCCDVVQDRGHRGCGDEMSPAAVLATAALRPHVLPRARGGAAGHRPGVLLTSMKRVLSGAPVPSLPALSSSLPAVIPLEFCCGLQRRRCVVLRGVVATQRGRSGLLRRRDGRPQAPPAG